MTAPAPAIERPPCPNCGKPMRNAKAWPGFRSGWVCLKGRKGALGGCGYHILGPEQPKVNCRQVVVRPAHCRQG